MSEQCAGLDVHQKTVVACALLGPAGGDPECERRTWATTTSQLLALGDWLRQRGITHVAMESTGTYWKPVWAVLEGQFDLTLRNAAHRGSFAAGDHLRDAEQRPKLPGSGQRFL